MTFPRDAMPQAAGAPAQIETWPARMPDRQAKTRSSHPSTHLDLRIQKKILHFDQVIAGFRQRRWS